jgi:citrate synthase
MIVAAYDRIRKGKPVVEADASLSHAANFLLQLNGTKPSTTAERALDIALILHADHELNASTFAARVTAATLSDMHSAITSAIGALKGPLHGGANEAVFRILESIDRDKADPVDYVRRKKFPASAIACITRKIHELLTCASCRVISAVPAGSPSGMRCRRKSRSS